MNAKKVVVEYRYVDYFSPDENEIGVYYPAEGRVLVADANGLVGIYNCEPTDRVDVVKVDLRTDGMDYTSDNPEYIVGLIMSGGAQE